MTSHLQDENHKAFLAIAATGFAVRFGTLELSLTSQLWRLSLFAKTYETNQWIEVKSSSERMGSRFKQIGSCAFFQPYCDSEYDLFRPCVDHKKESRIGNTIFCGLESHRGWVVRLVAARTSRTWSRGGQLRRYPRIWGTNSGGWRESCREGRCTGKRTLRTAARRRSWTGRFRR